MEPRPLRRVLSRANALLLFLLAASLVVANEIASQSSPPPRPTGPGECTAAERRDVLAEERTAVLKLLEGHTVLRNQADIDALAKPPLNYVFLAHQFTSFAGIGLTIISPFDKVRAGAPNLVFYAPRKGADATDPRGPDFPYTLVGWGYGVPYEPGRLPAVLPCMGLDDWHIHERGVHPIATGGMTVMPPAEQHYGESSGSFLDAPVMEPVVGFPHGRSWTVHLWLDRGGPLTSAILDPKDPPAGIDPGVGSSFYFPEKPPNGPVVAAAASRIKPYIIRRSEGKPVDLAGSTFAFKATDDETAGALTLIEAELKRGSEPPEHIHHREAEAFYLLDGEMTFKVAGQTFSAQTGDFVFLPRGVAHAYRVDGDGDARVLILSSPPGLDRFFKEAGEGDPRDPRISRAAGIEPVGPPLRALP